MSFPPASALKPAVSSLVGGAAREYVSSDYKQYVVMALCATASVAACGAEIAPMG
ncbi:hypothetical protein [Microbacterium sp. W4I20]|uniref:hypothetical protein n=1 Tax=Microbacterium sp. W4I20 TaxID=3042262 RepID=UPI0027847339|nr:hypothetical protein [Microbacterium sp. W4I20]MDQ0727800.1 hypothetical protein [Microbacterium sp. W4I20]